MLLKRPCTKDVNIVFGLTKSVKKNKTERGIFNELD